MTLNHTRLPIPSLALESERGGDRTHDPRVKSPLLYLTELPAHVIQLSKLGERRGSNPRQPGPQPGALPTELRPP